MAAAEANLRRARAAVSLVFLVNGAGIGLWIPHIPVLRARLGLDDLALGFALLSMSLGAVLGIPLVGPLLARYGSRAVSGAAGLLFCGALSLPFRATGYLTFLLALFALGFTNGAMDVAMNVHASRIESAAGRAVMSSFHGLWSLGSLLGAGVATLSLARSFGGIRTMTLASVLLAPLLVLACQGLLPGLEPRSPAGRGLRLATRPLILLGLLAVVGMMSEGAVADWSGVYLTTVVGMGVARAGLVFTLLSLTGTVGRLALGDRAVRAWGRRPVLQGSALLAASGVLLAVAVPHAVAASLGFGLAWLGLTSVVPILFSAAGQQPGVERGRGLGAVATLGYVGFLAGPPLIGVVAGWAGLRAGLLVIPVACLVVVLAGTSRALHLP